MSQSERCHMGGTMATRRTSRMQEERRQPQASYGGNPNRERRQHCLASPLGNFEKLTKRTNSCERGSLVNINFTHDL
jgi:hypothetical protein